MSNNRFVFLDESKNDENRKDEPFPYISDEQISEQNKGIIPRNTQRSTNWTTKLWDQWAEFRNNVQTNELFPKIPKIDSINTISDKNLDQLLRRFIFEVRKTNGEPYPPNSLMVLVAGLQRHIRENGKPTCNLFEKSDRTFHKFHGALDARLKELTAQGFGIDTKQPKEITVEEEKVLWDNGNLSIHSSVGLSNAIFFYTCKVFGLRSGDEHRSLKFSQFEVGENQHDRYVRFQGEASKTKNSGLSSIKREFKNLIQYEDPENPRCYYNIFTLYKSLLPKDCKEFYYQPVSNGANPLMFSVNVIGRNKLSQYVQTMMKTAGFEGFYTNLSVKAALCTDLYAKGSDEQLVAERSGHKSSAIRRYKRTTNEQHKTMSNELDLPANKPSTLSTANCKRRLSTPKKTDLNTENKKRKHADDGSENRQCSSILNYTHKKYDMRYRQSVSVYDNNRKILICDSCGSEITNSQTNFDINIGDFLPSDVTLVPKNITLRGLTTRRGGQLIVKIDYSVFM